MKRLVLNDKVRNAIIIGSICSVSYLAVYLARNILSAVSPQMIELNIVSVESVGTLSSVFFISYAVGQLINGYIGDKIKAKYMISLGLIFAGISNFAFSLLTNQNIAPFVAYGITGFSLAMIYGPMTKLVAENTEPVHATRCSLGYTFSSFFGSPLAGLLAVGLTWKLVFALSSLVLVVMALICFYILFKLENKGVITYGKYEKPKTKNGGIKILIKNSIIKFTLISIITGIVRTTVVFWLPVYLSDYLNFDSKTSALLFTISTFCISLSAFIAIFVYEKLNNNMNLTVLLSFISALICFTMVYMFKNEIANITFMVLAIMSSNCAASMLWSRYCPSLRDTGMVSSATGFLDFVSYMAAALSSTFFANATTAIGWHGLILIWMGLMFFGIIVCLPNYLIKKNNKIL